MTFPAGDLQPDIIAAAESGDLEELKRLLNDGADLNTRGSAGCTCLMTACSKGHLPLIKFLLEEKNMNIEEKDDNGTTCFYFACNNDNLPIIKYLAEERGANTEVRDSYNETPFINACRNGHLSLVKYLVEECSVDMDTVNCHHESGLVQACRYGHRPIVKYLIINQWMKPPRPPVSFNFPWRVKKYLEKCNNSYLTEKRRKYWSQYRTEMRRFLHDSHLEEEWNSHQQPTFFQGASLYVSYVHQLLEKNPGPPADLKVCFSSPTGSKNVVVYTKKNQLSASCEFMKNLLNGEMNDVQDDPEQEGMQTVELNQELIQDCPAEWLKQLIAFLSWSREGDSLRHSMRSNAKTCSVSFDDIMEALKYCRLCDTLGIEVDVSVWTDFIKEYVEQYNNQWIESMMQTGQITTEKGFCIKFDHEMFELWTGVLGESDEVYFFMLVNAAPATIETRSTIASECRNWFVSDESSKRYSETLQDPFFVALLNLHTGFNVGNGAVSVLVEKETEEAFVPRKRKRTEP